MKLDITPHLTTVDAALERAVGATHKGMAHWAGTGPHEKKCGDCRHWQGKRGDKEAQCAEYWRLMGRSPARSGHKVPRHTAACRHFAQS